ncbi:MAG TPA: AraC family transcriptional regulator [Amycolatopsis sp.]|nr:AraC family transcriptional regulator [Amycolatopsis sp.]
MDAISRLIQLARPEGCVDLRCLLGGRFELENPATSPETAPFHLLLAGRALVEFAGRTIELSPGDVVLFPRGTAHRVFTDRGGEPVRTVAEPGVAFPTLRSPGAQPEIDLFCGHYRLTPGAGELLLRTLPEPLLVSFGADEPVRMLSTLMRQEAQANGLGAATVVSSLCNALLAMVLRSSPQQRLSGEMLWTAADDDAVRSVIDAVLSEPGRDWGITQLAHRAAMSRATFIRHFRLGTGMAVGEFLTRLRMMIAADLLLGGNQPVSAIANAVGYRSTSAFGRAFRAATATTPARFRSHRRGVRSRSSTEQAADAEQEPVRADER